MGDMSSKKEGWDKNMDYWVIFTYVYRLVQNLPKILIWESNRYKNKVPKTKIDRYSLQIKVGKSNFFNYLVLLVYTAIFHTTINNRINFLHKCMDKIISQYSSQSTQLTIIKINIRIVCKMHRLALIKSAISNTITLDNLTELKLTREGNIATIWFNTPAALNAVSNRMTDQFRFLLPHLDNDDSVKIIAIRSNHKKVFCAGADIKDFLVNYESNRYNAVRPLNLGKTFRSVRKVLIAVVQGAALGGGFQIALHCDIILCSEKATFGLPEINLGLIPALGGTQNLAKIVGTKVTSRLILTGETLNATQAHRLNIAHLIQGQNFEEKVKQFFNNLSNKALDSLQAGKKAVKLSLDTTLQQGLQHETTIFQALFNKKGPKEGISAFVQKRKPNFKNI